jgi:hypothetical protein
LGGEPCKGTPVACKNREDKEQEQKGELNMQLSLEQLVISVLGCGAMISLAALGFFLKGTFADIKKELSQLNANVTQLIIQGSNSSLRHERAEAEIASIRQRIHHIENTMTQVSLIQQRCTHCNGG